MYPSADNRTHYWLHIGQEEVYPSADVGSNHQLLASNVRLMLIAGKKCKGIRHYNIEKLSDQLMADDYDRRDISSCDSEP